MPGGLGIAPVTMPTHAVPPSHAGRSDKRRPLTVQSPSHRASNHGPVSPLSRAKRQAEGGVPYGSELAANRPNTTTAAGTGVAKTSNEAWNPTVAVSETTGACRGRTEPRESS